MMTVKELIQLLQKYPDEAEVFGYYPFEEDEDLRHFIIRNVYQDSRSLGGFEANDILINIVRL